MSDTASIPASTSPRALLDWSAYPSYLDIESAIPRDFTPAPRRQYTLVFYVSSVPFTREVVMGRTSLGGSESACLDVAKGLAERGHDVHIFADQLDEALDDQIIDGVVWHGAERTMIASLRFLTPDSFVSLRHPAAVALPVHTAKHIGLWCQDLCTDPGVGGALAAVDEMIYVSRYQAEQWMRACVETRNIPHWVTKNPIDCTLLPPEPPPGFRRRPRFLHLSRPERGYDALFAMWPEIQQRYPDHTLALCRYNSMYDAHGWGRVVERYERKAGELGGVVLLGELTKAALYRELSTSALMLYPTSQPSFAETNGIAYTEAQACGTPIVADARGASPETVAPGAGILIPNTDAETWKTAEYQAEFLAGIDHYLHSSAAYQEAAQIGRAQGARADRRFVAWAWERRLDTFFESRYRSRTLGILRRHLHDDDHVVGQLVAEAVINAGLEGDEDLPAFDQDAIDEATDAAALCRRVIAQEEHTAADYARHALPDPLEEVDCPRFTRILERLRALFPDPDHPPRRVLDLACGNGSFAIALGRAYPQLQYLGVDFSPGVLDIARDGVGRAFNTEEVSRFTFLQSDFASFLADPPPEAASGHFDLVFCGEFLEHVEHPWTLLDRLEEFADPDRGRVLLTTPCGPFAELLGRTQERSRGHLHAFTHRHISTLLSTKREATWEYAPSGISPQGSWCGFWLLGYRPGGGPAPPLDYAHTIVTTRPYQRLHACLITKDEEDWIAGCVKSLACCDRVRVYDTGSTDDTVAIAEAHGAEVTRIRWPEDFSVARNRSIQEAMAGGRDGAEWVLWIDADERLVGGVSLRSVLKGGGPFNAYAIKQHHLHLDLDDFSDRPERVFRTRPIGPGGLPDPVATPRFFGAVHEQPGRALNFAIEPALLLDATRIAHFGYYTGSIRGEKATARNTALLDKELRGEGQHPPRRLAWALKMRDLVQEAEGLVRRGHVDEGRTRAAQALAIYRKHGWDDPDGEPLWHDLAWPYAQVALQVLGGLHVAVSVVVDRERVDRPTPPERFRAMSADDATRLIQSRVKKAVDAIRPLVIDVRPYDLMMTDAVAAEAGVTPGDPPTDSGPTPSLVRQPPVAGSLPPVETEV